MASSKARSEVGAGVMGWGGGVVGLGVVVGSRARLTSILPVTAAETRAVRYSLRWAMASVTLAIIASILAVSLRTKATI